MEHTEHDIPVDGSEDTTLRIPIFSQLGILGAVLFLLLSASITPKLIAALSPETVPSAVIETLPPLTPQAVGSEAFSGLNLEAEAVFLWDVANQRVVYAENADAELPLASITKLMTALIANELLTATTTIQISEAAINQDGASGLREAEQFTLASLSDLILLSSSNDGAFAIAETLGRAFTDSNPAEAFVALMNIRAEELGLTQTSFRNPTGLDISATEAGASGSARDVAFLMEHILTTTPGILEATADPAHTIISQNGFTHSVRNTNQNVATIPGVIGSKTGYTELAGGNLVVAFDAAINRPFVAVVLGSSWQGRFDDIDDLITTTRTSLNQ